jgi:hypothetical protein
MEIYTQVPDKVTARSGCCTSLLYGTFRRLVVDTSKPPDLGALGGTRTPNLLIRRDLRSSPLPAHMQLTCWNVAQRCSMAGDVERCCKANLRPAGLGATEDWP